VGTAKLQTDTAGSLEPLRHTKTIALVTFRRDGTAVVTPWHKTWKTKRLAHAPDVEVAPSDLRGHATGPAIRACARLLNGDDARVGARALARRHRVLHALLVPLTHRLTRYRTMHYELLAATSAGGGACADG
jgi:hypothetical protein